MLRSKIGFSNYLKGVEMGRNWFCNNCISSNDFIKSCSVPFSAEMPPRCILDDRESDWKIYHPKQKEPIEDGYEVVDYNTAYEAIGNGDKIRPIGLSYWAEFSTTREFVNNGGKNLYYSPSQYAGKWEIKKKAPESFEVWCSCDSDGISVISSTEDEARPLFDISRRPCSNLKDNLFPKGKPVRYILTPTEELENIIETKF